MDGRAVWAFGYHVEGGVMLFRKVPPVPKPPFKDSPFIPVPEGLILTHILQMDCRKRPGKRIALADCFIDSTVPIRSTGSPKKIWVRIRLQRWG